jgi:hypothetical protein
MRAFVTREEQMGFALGRRCANVRDFLSVMALEGVCKIDEGCAFPRTMTMSLWSVGRA